MEVTYEITLDYGDRLTDDDAIPSEGDIERWVGHAIENTFLLERLRPRIIVVERQ